MKQLLNMLQKKVGCIIMLQHVGWHHGSLGNIVKSGLVMSHSVQEYGGIWYTYIGIDGKMRSIHLVLWVEQLSLLHPPLGPWDVKILI